MSAVRNFYFICLIINKFLIENIKTFHKDRSRRDNKENNGSQGRNRLDRGQSRRNTHKDFFGQLDDDPVCKFIAAIDRQGKKCCA